MGPVINERQFDRIQGYIQAGQTEGAKLIGGSGRYPVEGFEQGLFVQPTILMRLRARWRSHGKKSLAPYSVMTFKDEAEALQLANETMYGLTAAVWTKIWIPHSAWQKGFGLAQSG